MGVEVIAVFREEAKGVEGLQIIKDKTGVNFTLCLDTDAEHTSRYSPGRGEFDNYVIDKQGNIAAIIDGTLRKRALSDKLFEILEGLSGDSEDDDNH